MARNQDIQSVANEDTLFQRVSELIEASRKYVNKAIDTAMVYTYFGVGQYIVEYQQHGKSRAEYGKGVLKRLSERLSVFTQIPLHCSGFWNTVEFPLHRSGNLFLQVM